MVAECRLTQKSHLKSRNLRFFKTKISNISILLKLFFYVEIIFSTKTIK
jgi:hypothetical protein